MSPRPVAIEHRHRSLSAAWPLDPDRKTFRHMSRMMVKGSRGRKAGGGTGRA